MADTTNPFLRRLSAHIFELSNEKNDWAAACAEWVFTDRENLGPDSDNCPCGQYITYRYWIENKLNSNVTYVGSECVHKFIESEDLRHDVHEADLASKRKPSIPCEICGKPVYRSVSGDRKTHVKCVPRIDYTPEYIYQLLLEKADEFDKTKRDPNVFKQIRPVNWEPYLRRLDRAARDAKPFKPVTEVTISGLLSELKRVAWVCNIRKMTKHPERMTDRERLFYNDILRKARHPRFKLSPKQKSWLHAILMKCVRE